MGQSKQTNQSKHYLWANQNKLVNQNTIFARASLLYVKNNNYSTAQC
jgi:hypothetical protein